MSLRTEIQSYFDGNGLVAPNPVPTGQLKGSDNGTMFLSEYIIMLCKSKNLEVDDALYFNSALDRCISSNGMLNRTPVGQNDGLEQADDYYGTLNACMHLQETYTPGRFLKATLKYFGFLNNVDPGKISLDSFLIRQPQLLACMISASFPSLINPLHYLIRLLAFPLYMYAAIVISFSCINTDPNNADARRLSWHLVQITKRVSLMCNLASKIWYNRLYSTYPNGMKDVAALYYFPKGDNVFSRYWVN